MSSDIGTLLNLACIKHTGEPLPSSCLHLTQDWHYKKVGDKKEAIYRPLSDPLTPIMPLDDPEQAILRNALISDLNFVMTLHTQRSRVKVFFAIYQLTYLAFSWFLEFMARNGRKTISLKALTFKRIMFGRDDNFWHGDAMKFNSQCIKQEAIECIRNLASKGYDCVSFVADQYETFMRYGHSVSDCLAWHEKNQGISFRDLESTYERQRQNDKWTMMWLANEWFDKCASRNYRYGLERNDQRGISQVGMALMNIGFTKDTLPKAIDAILMAGKKNHKLNETFFTDRLAQRRQREKWDHRGYINQKILEHKMLNPAIHKINEMSEKKTGGIPKTQKGVSAYFKMRMVCIGSSLPFFTCDGSHFNAQSNDRSWRPFHSMSLRGTPAYDILLKEVDTNYWRCSMSNDVLLRSLAPDHKNKRKILNEKVLLQFQ